MKKLLLPAFIAIFAAGIAQSDVVDDVLRLRPGTLPSAGSAGELRVDSATGGLRQWDTTSSQWTGVSDQLAANPTDCDAGEFATEIDAAGNLTCAQVQGSELAAGAFDDIAPTTTKGDLVVHDGDGNVRQAVGSHGQYLMADTGSDTGMSWSAGPGALPTGAVLEWEFATAPDGFVLLKGGTIGSASSGATARANADTEALFTLIWESYDNTERPIQNSDGSPGTRGASAADDFAADKRIGVGRILGPEETVFIQDQKPDSEDGGTFTSGAWRIRDLNTLINPLGYNWVSLASNEFTLQPGIYKFKAKCPAYRVEVNKARLWNVTASAVELWGSVATAVDVSNATPGSSDIEGFINVVTPSIYQIEHRGSLTRASNGFGDGNGGSIGGGTTEIFTRVEITRMPDNWIQKL